MTIYSVYGVDDNDKDLLLTRDLVVVNGNYALQRDEFGVVRVRRPDRTSTVVVLKGYIRQKGWEDYNGTIKRFRNGERTVPSKACRICGHKSEWKDTSALSAQHVP